MKQSLLIERHPDITERIENMCKKYTRLDENGNVLECLSRNTLDDNFVDITEIEKERVKLANYEKELARMRRKANELKEKEIDYGQTSSTTSSNY